MSCMRSVQFILQIRRLKLFILMRMIQFFLFNAYSSTLSLERKRMRNGVLPPRDGQTPGKVEEMIDTPLNAVIRRVRSTPRGCRKKMAGKATTHLRREDKGDPRAPGQGGTYHPAEDGAGAGPAESGWDDQ
jgi:hypothetical protein